ncbi:MAG: hypothetical protein IKC56_02050 [Clostridia bacterium]|nr:hypothetical protein [Clostridia bacterium]
MNKAKLLSRIFIVALLSLTVFLPLGVKGVWHYAMASSSTIDLPMSVEVFPWVGADKLPNDVMGEDHGHLIGMILNGTYTDPSSGTVTNIGLNNPDSYISSEIKSRTEGSIFFRSDTLGSMDYWEDQDISKFFDTATTGLAFLLYFPNGKASPYYLYTTSVVLGKDSPNIPIGEDIYPVYRTKIELNSEGVWKATETLTGYADSDYYENPITGSWLVKYPSINPSSWAEGDLGLTKETAIYAAIGQTYTAYNQDTTTPKYYKIKRSSKGNVTVTGTESTHVVNVYDQNMKAVSTSGGTKQGSNKVTFSASANATYYVIVSGATTLTFSIQ